MRGLLRLTRRWPGTRRPARFPPITVEDVLSFRLGFGNVFTPEPLPIVQAAEEELKLRTLGPPWPPTPHNPDQWIAALGSLPLIDQPGERFLYNTGAMVAGILIERVTGAPFAEVLSKRVFEPLGMADTAFHVPAAKLARFTSMYAPRAAHPADAGLAGAARGGQGLLVLRLRRARLAASGAGFLGPASWPGF